MSHETSLHVQSRGNTYHCDLGQIQPPSKRKLGPYANEAQAVEMTGKPVEVLRAMFPRAKRKESGKSAPLSGTDELGQGQTFTVKSKGQRVKKPNIYADLYA